MTEYDVYGVQNVLDFLGPVVLDVLSRVRRVGIIKMLTQALCWPILATPENASIPEILIFYRDSSSPESSTRLVFYLLRRGGELIKTIFFNYLKYLIHIVIHS